ncbi:MAG: Holliday junction branch migration protein RuvA [Clostridia bacterium]|nr:Holliday junction branch migration protein RuvA [Clostridia bacterium]
MIAYLKGNVIHVGDNNVLVLENGGLGYEITCSSAAFSRLVMAKGGEVYTYLAVREDGVFLYGFDSYAEKNMFLKLITVSGVGPKMGITVLSGMSLNDLAFAIAASDIKSLSKIKGLGKKTAERIVLELREAIGEVGESSAAKGATPISKLSNDGEDAIIALMGLGYTRTQASSSVQAAIEAGAKGLENIIREALKRFA